MFLAIIQFVVFKVRVWLKIKRICVMENNGIKVGNGSLLS